MASKIGPNALKNLKVVLNIGRQYSAHGSAQWKAEKKKSAEAWKSVFLFVGCPTIALAAVNAFVLAKHPERPEFVAYPHLRIRTKAFPWGDGNKTLFHHPYWNALPDGYEEGSEELRPGKH